jgi:hypothetical protein
MNTKPFLGGIRRTLPVQLLGLFLLSGTAQAQQSYAQPDYSQQSTYPAAPAGSPYPGQATTPGQASPFPSDPNVQQPGIYQAPASPNQASPGQPVQQYTPPQAIQPQPGFPQTGGLQAQPFNQPYNQQPQAWTPPQAVQPVAGQVVPAVPSGPCSVKLSTDRSTILLTDPASGVERNHLSLGSDRVQRVFTSPDGAWGVAVYKVRGVAQFGFIALDLKACEDQMPVELPAPAASAGFEQDEVVLKLEKGAVQRFPLKNARIQ